LVQFNIAITRRRALAAILVVISILIIDSTIVKYIAFSNKELPTSTYIRIFVTFTIVFVGIIFVVLGFVKSKDQRSELKISLIAKISYFLIVLTQLSLITIMVLIILQITLMKIYSTISLLAIVYISHITAVVFLILLVVAFIDWMRTKHNKILSLYTISFSLTAVAIMISLIYATNAIAYQELDIRPYPIHLSVINLPGSELANSFGSTLDIISILSFISVWFASAILLSTYSRRIGKFRYWIIISIPLIYFLFPFEGYLINVFQPLAISSPVFFGLVNVLVFSATKQIGALFFSLTFLAASTLVANQVTQKYLLLSAIGIAVLYGSIEIDALLYTTYPPFGLVTISFMPIGSYLVFTGISLSATLVARDKDLRREFYNTAMSQLNLLKTIGITEMENQLIKNYKSIEKRTQSLELKDTTYDKGMIGEALHGLDDIDEGDVRELVRDVLTEVYLKSKAKSNT
jgi:hypothetical protein